MPRKGKYLTLKTDLATLNIQRYDPKTAYSTDDKIIASFVKFCDKQSEENKINPYPLLHQLHNGNLIVKNKSYPAEMWLEMAKRAIDLPKSKLKKKLEI